MFRIPSNSSKLETLALEKANKTQEAWTAPTLLNGWVNYGFVDAGYFIDDFGIVHIRGMVSSGSGIVFILPEGYRPSARVVMVITSNAGDGRVDVDTNGSVEVVVGSATWTSLNNLSFKV